MPLCQCVFGQWWSFSRRTVLLPCCHPCLLHPRKTVIVTYSVLVPFHTWQDTLYCILLSLQQVALSPISCRHSSLFCVDFYPGTHPSLPKVSFANLITIMNYKYLFRTFISFWILTRAHTSFVADSSCLNYFQIWNILPTFFFDLQKEGRPSLQSILQALGNLSKLKTSIYRM